MSLKTLALIGGTCLVAGGVWFFFLRPAPDAAAEGELPARLTTGRFDLSKEQQRYIWDVEHLWFVLNQDVAPLFKSAIRGEDAAALRRLFAPDFTGSVLSGDGSDVTHGAVLHRRWESPTAPAAEVDADGFLAELVRWGEQFASIDSVGIHSTTLAPVRHGDLAGAFTSVWDVRVAGTTRDGGRAERLIDLSFAFARLSEQPADDDGFISGAEVLRSWENRSASMLMQEITETTGIRVDGFVDNWKRFGPPYWPVTGGALLLDIERDGLCDLLVTGEPAHYLYRANGDGTFEDVTETSGLPVGSKVVGAVAADLDGDGFEDLVLSVVAGGRLVDTDVYRNRGDGAFELIPRERHDLGGHVISDQGMAVADYDSDGRVDLYIPKGGRQASAAAGGPRWIGDRTSPEGLLLRNLGNWRFADVTEKAGLTGENVDTFANVWLDIEPDGDADLFLANHMGGNVLWRNDGDGTFTKLPLPQQGFGGFSMGATSGDFDGDGDPDVYVANMYSSAGSRVIGNLRPEDYPVDALPFIQGFVTGNELYINDGRGGLTPIGVAAGVANSGWSYGPSGVDLDGDGALDLYAPAGFQSVKRGEPDG